jgi:hypothetical protein
MFQALFHKLKDLRILLAVILVLTWIIASVVIFFLVSSNSKNVTDREAEIQNLNGSIQQIGEMVTAFSLATDAPLGKKIEETDLTTVAVPMSSATNLVLDMNELVGKFVKLNLTAGTSLSKDMIQDSELTDDMRLFDVVLNTVPVGLKEGSYVDVRITMPLGEDFIAIPHKRVYSINAGVLKLAVNEQDIHTYNSMLIDSLLYQGTTLYATEYVEGGVQKPADAYYPLSRNILTIAQKDPNLVAAIKSDILKRRGTLENGLTTITAAQNAQAQDSLNVILQRGREKYETYVQEASKEHAIQVEREAEIARQNGQ